MATTPKILYLDGIRFKRAIVAAANWLSQMQNYLDNINVFPVPDHDTGTNMAHTMHCIAENIQDSPDTSACGIMRAVADSALLDAQGNSGAILAQFFLGFSEGLRDAERIDTGTFAAAAGRGAAFSRDAIMDPREGTILTIIREWANHTERLSSETDDFHVLLRDSYAAARELLKDTTGKLESLRKAGVVDAGAQGFVYILEGTVDFMNNGRIDRKLETTAAVKLESVAVTDDSFENTKFRYCTECLLTGDSIDIGMLKNDMGPLGDSIVVAGSSRKARIHIHTNDPSSVVNIVSAHGRILQDKVDDMHQQHADTYSREKPSVAIVTDSTCDLPAELLQKHNIHMVPLHVHFGESSFIDKFTISTSTFYERLLTSEHHPKTSQPNPRDFMRMYEFLARHYDSVISIHISSRLSGTFQAAQKSAKAVSDNITVIDSKTASIGLGLIVLQAARAAERGSGRDEVVSTVNRMIENSTLFLAPETIEYLIKGGRIGKVKGIFGRLLNLKPVFIINDEGAIQVIGKTTGRASIHKKTMETIKKTAAGRQNFCFIVGSGNSPEVQDWYRREITNHFNPDELLTADISPVIGVHVGPSAAGVAFAWL